MITTLILDAGGVLVYPVRGQWNIPCALPFEPGDGWPQAAANAVEHLREDIFIPDMAAEQEKRLLFLQSVNAQLKWGFSEGELQALAADFTRNPARYGWYDDIEPLLQRWQGKYRIGMLTDAMPSFPEFVRLRGIDKYFETIVASTEIGCTKPAAPMYLEICRRMGVAPQECLFVDDRPCNLDGAQTVGMAAVQMCRDGLAPWNGPFVRNLAELDIYVEGLNEPVSP